MTKTPSADDLHTAAQWLDVYEGAEEFPSEILDCWRNPTLDCLESVLSPFATCTLEQ